MDNVQVPLVSVVFTSYNHAEFLVQALESILDQSFGSFEVIVVDDCSTDGSRDILERYRNHPKMNLQLREKNSGSYVKASNYGASFARGQYILFAQCDDYADSSQLDQLVQAITGEEGIGVAFSRSYMVDKHGNVFDDDYRGREKKFRDRCVHDTRLKGVEMRRFLSYSCVLPNLSAALVNRSIFEKVGGLSEKYLVASDWAFWLTMAEHTDFYYLTQPLNHFRQHETTIRSTIKVQRQLLEIFSIFYEHLHAYHLKGSASYHMRAGAGFVWISFAFDGLGAWLKCFPAVLRKTFRLEKLNLWFLLTGCFVYLRETIYNRVTKRPARPVIQSS